MVSPGKGGGWFHQYAQETPTFRPGRDSAAATSRLLHLLCPYGPGYAGISAHLPSGMLATGSCLAAAVGT